MKLQQGRLFSNRVLVQLILPLIIEQTLATLVGMCDGVMVSSVGEAAISGVSLVDMINAIVLNLFAALATGGAVIISQFLGARQEESARKSVGQLVLTSGFFGLVMMALCLAFAHNLLRFFFGAIEQDVMDAGLTYFRITALSFPFIALYNAGAAVFRSIGNSKVSMKVSLLMNAINVSGNALCIYGLHMGVIGVAIPTLISRAVAAVVILWLNSRRSQTLCLELGNLTHIQGKMMRKILYIGIPSAFENSLFQLGRVIVVSMVTPFGTIHTTANAVGNTLCALALPIGQGIGLAMVTVVGQCIGAGDTDQAVYYIKKLMFWTYALQGACHALMIALCPQLVGLYRSLSPETFTLATRLLYMYHAFALLMYAPAFTLPNALRAANDVRFTLLVSVGSMLLFRIGSAWLLCTRMGYGVTGAWIAMFIDWVCRTIFFSWRYFSGKWKTKYYTHETAHSGRLSKT